jgi:hypothetical protein
MKNFGESLIRDLKMISMLLSVSPSQPAGWKIAKLDCNARTFRHGAQKIQILFLISIHRESICM